MPPDTLPDTPASPQNSSARRLSFMLILWAEGEIDAAAWRGYLEAADGRRHYFQTLAALGEILHAWHVSLES